MTEAFVKSVQKPILPGKTVYTSFFAQIPYINGKQPPIVSMARFGTSLYVCTSTNGHIFRVSKEGKVSLWFDVKRAMVKSTGRQMNTGSFIHGGLRSVAFHPSFRNSGLFYTAVMEDKPRPGVNLPYFSRSSVRSVPDSVVIEWKYDWKTQKVIDTSYRQVIRIEMPVYDHPIRALLFHNNLLFITHGDGSVQSASTGGGLKNDGLGKVLRINPLRQGGKPYTVPNSNPFVGNPKFKNEIFAIGFRNPMTICMSSHPAVGLIGVDVGRDNADEINLVKAGRNYGWSKREGTFVHKPQGGLGTGIGPLPDDDAKYGFTYPVVQVGHYGDVRGEKFVGQALTGSCPIENTSPLKNLILYADFAKTGNLFYSNIWDMVNAVTSGPPNKLTQATTYRPTILFDHDNNPKTPPKRVANLREIIRMEPGRSGEDRSDIRFGQGYRGEIYWSSKQNGKIYIITNSIPRVGKKIP